MLKNLLSTLKSLISTAWKFTGTIPYMRLILLLVIFTLVIIAYFNCGSGQSKTEKELLEKTGEAIEAEAETKVTAEEVKEKEAETVVRRQATKTARVNANKKVKEAEEVRNEDTKGTTPEAANRLRCQAYSQSSECKQGS
jgi:hypothetical protein